MRCNDLMIIKFVIFCYNNLIIALKNGKNYAPLQYIPPIINNTNHQQYTCPILHNKRTIIQEIHYNIRRRLNHRRYRNLFAKARISRYHNMGHETVVPVGEGYSEWRRLANSSEARRSSVCQGSRLRGADVESGTQCRRAYVR